MNIFYFILVFVCYWQCWTFKVSSHGVAGAGAGAGGGANVRVQK